MSRTRQTRLVGQKLDCLNSNPDLVKLAAQRKNVWYRCHPLLWSVERTRVPFSGGKGDQRGRFKG